MAFSLLTFLVFSALAAPIYLLYSILSRWYVDPIRITDKVYEKTIFINGLFGWSTQQKINSVLPYWNNYIDRCKTATVGFVSNYRMRAYETVASIMGWKYIHYGLLFSHRRQMLGVRNPFPTPLCSQWAEANPLQFVGHSAGCGTILQLYIYLCKHKETVTTKLLPFMVCLSEHQGMNMTAAQYEEKKKNISLPSVDPIDYFHSQFKTIEERKRALYYFEHMYDDHDFLLFYDPSYLIPKGWGPKCIEKSVFVSAPFKGVPFMCHLGYDYPNQLNQREQTCYESTHKQVRLRPYSIIWLSYVLIWCIQYIIPNWMYTNYLQTYTSLHHFLQSNSQLGFDFIQPISVSLCHQFMEFYQKHPFPVLTATSLSSFDVQRGWLSRARLERWISPFSNFVLLFFVTLFGAGRILDYSDTFSKNVFNKEEWSTELTPTDGVVCYDSQTYLHQHIHGDEKNIIMDADHISCVGIMSKSFTIRKQWECIVEYLYSS